MWNDSTINAINVHVQLIIFIMIMACVICGRECCTCADTVHFATFMALLDHNNALYNYTKNLNLNLVHAHALI